MSETIKRFTYGKNQKLKSSRLIDLLFKEGKSIQQYPLRLIWLPVNHEQKLQVGVAVSKRFFAKAVDRNKIKRHLREAWRLKKHAVAAQIQEKELCVAGMIVFTGKDILDHNLIATSMEKLLEKFQQNLEKL